MLNSKEFAEKILSDLMNNGSISDILLATKIFAAKRDDKQLLEWVTRELEGYKDEKPPKYRILNSALKVTVFVPYSGTTSVDFPAEIIKEKDIRERLSNMPFHNSIAEIESLCNDGVNERTISMRIPVHVYHVMSPFVNGDIQDAYQYTTKAAVSQILVAVKSVLIDFLLKVCNDDEIDFNTFIQKNPKMNSVIINAGIVNMGHGDVNAQGSTNIVGDKNIINEEIKGKLLRIIGEIDYKTKEHHTNPDYNEILTDIQAELLKDNPAKNYLKRCFQAILSFFNGVGAGVVANDVTPLINSAIALVC